MARDRAQQRVVLEALAELLERAFRAYYPRVPSRTLRKALTIQLGTRETDLLDNEGALYIPHYWAVYLHDGRGPVQPREAKFIVFYHRPQDDPRLVDGYPERVSDIRKLSKGEFQAGLQRNRVHAQLGLPPFMYVLKDDQGRPRSAGPADGTRWFERNEGVADKATPKIESILDKYVQSIVVSESLTAKTKLRFR